MTDYPENEKTLCITPQTPREPEPKAWHRIIAWTMVWAAGLLMAYIFAPILAFVATTVLFAFILAAFVKLPSGVDRSARFRIGGRKW